VVRLELKPNQLAFRQADHPSDWNAAAPGNPGEANLITYLFPLGGIDAAALLRQGSDAGSELLGRLVFRCKP
jgi:hypothetical protein